MPHIGRRRREQLELMKRGERYIINPLEQMMLAWQDRWRLIRFMHAAGVSVGRPLCTDIGALVHFEELPTFLLNVHSRTEAETLRDLPKFNSPPDLPVGWGNDMLNVPANLICWTRSGRRLWVVTDELQSILRTALLSEITFDDITFPLDSFCLKIDKPIPTPGGDGFDFFIVTGGDKISRTNITALGISRNQHRALSSAQIAHMDRCLRTGRIADLVDLVKGYLQRFAFPQPGARLSCGAPSIVIDPKDLGKEQVAALATKLSVNEPEQGAQWREVWQQVLQLVCGFAIYLDSLHSDRERQQCLHTNQRAPDLDKEPDRKRITEGSQVCMVSSAWKLTAEGQHEFFEQLEGRHQGQRRVMPWHVRRRHKRRLSGYGNDPEAWNHPELVLEIPATFVREDRKTDSSAPGGAIHNLLTKRSPLNLGPNR